MNANAAAHEPPVRIEASGDRLVIVDFNAHRHPDAVLRANRNACATAQRLLAANLPGVTDIVPALTTVGGITIRQPYREPRKRFRRAH